MKYILVSLWALMISVVSATAQGDYQIRPGDTLAVEVLEDSSLNRSLLVLPDGTVNFPFAGTVRAGGRTASQVQQEITNEIASNFASSPTVFVTVAAVRPELPLGDTGAIGIADGINIYYLGEINAPGVRQVTAGTTFLQAVAQSGGFTRFAATKRVQLRRFDPSSGTQRIFTMNFKALGDGGALENDIVLREGDIILVPERRLFE